VKEVSDTAMPSENGLSEPQEAMLFAIWKLRGIGGNSITEDQLKAQMSNQAPEAEASTLAQLQSLGFVEVTNNNGPKAISITPLGVAILRKVEEDRLHEVR
jgi:predicted transcriptional regulator